MRRAIASGIGLLLLAGCTHRMPKDATSPEDTTSQSGLESMLRAQPSLRAFVEDAAPYKLQVVLGTVVEDAEGPRLRQQTFRAGAEYFYPASTVKLFAAIAALEHASALRAETGLPIDVDTPLVFHPLFDDEARESTDETNLEAGTITLRHEIRKLFLVSDNQAFNRLYELVGQDGLADSLRHAGLGDARLVHRLSESRSAEENRRAPRIDFMGIDPADDDVLHMLPERAALPMPPPPPMSGLEVGTAYLDDGTRIDEPLDFTAKNRIALTDLQRGLCMVVRPDVDCGAGAGSGVDLGFDLDDTDRELLSSAMTALPRESANPRYDPTDYPDDYVKFLLPGLQRLSPEGTDATDRWRIRNKIGQAYGFTTENAYVEDADTGRSFFLAATIYTNADGVLNDDQYEYDTVAQPFMADLGEAVARHLGLASSAAEDRASAEE